MLRPRTQVNVFIDYAPFGWDAFDPTAEDMARENPLYVVNGCTFFALWYVASMPDDLRMDAMDYYLDVETILERLAA